MANKPYVLECVIPVKAGNASVRICFQPKEHRQFSVEWQQDADRPVKTERFWTLSEAVAHKDHMVTALNLAAESATRNRPSADPETASDGFTDPRDEDAAVQDECDDAREAERNFPFSGSF